ncbi:uncharacterized protein LOC118205857, partial [Stegodyphus dumicola]|uniref:uncharacterized protein LOC118205857 n=1 Tax=Stegodyphus dumicola TaxID=202533 RepID=UPI0015A9CB76
MRSKIRNYENDKTSQNENESEVVKTLSISYNYSVSYLQTLIAHIVVDNKPYPVRVLCDSDSQKSYIKNSIAKEFNLIPQRKRYAVKALEVPIPPLPENRTKMLKTFEVTGIDLAGPVFLKRNLKAWIVIFTCADFRAVQLELNTSLSTNVFIDAIRRFISRRGRVGVTYSDNDSNFVGLNKAMNQLVWADIERKYVLLKIKWKFNPPTASWWGGFWERLIRILKDLNLRHACLRYEEFLILLCKCESLMNNRPLTYLSEEGDDLSPLKPSMFLQNVIDSNVYDLDEINSMSIIERWKTLQRVREGLRNRFKKAYLGFLRNIAKGKRRIIKVNDIALIGNDNKKHIDWTLGRVLELFPGKDNITRLVKLKPCSGVVLRPFQRFFPFELNKSSDKLPFMGNNV